MLWHLQIDPAAGNADREGARIAAEAAELGLLGPWRVSASRGFLLAGSLDVEDVLRAARAVLVDPVVAPFAVQPRGPAAGGSETTVYVLPKPGVTDPEAESAGATLRALGFAVDGVRTIRTYRISGPADSLSRLIQRVLANDAVE